MFSMFAILLVNKTTTQADVPETVHFVRLLHAICQFQMVACVQINAKNWCIIVTLTCVKTVCADSNKLNEFWLEIFCYVNSAGVISSFINSSWDGPLRNLFQRLSGPLPSPWSTFLLVVKTRWCWDNRVQVQLPFHLLGIPISNFLIVFVSVVWFRPHAMLFGCCFNPDFQPIPNQEI